MTKKKATRKKKSTTEKSEPVLTSDMRKYKQPGDKVLTITTHVLQRKCAACQTPFIVAYPQGHTARYCPTNACKMRRRRGRGDDAFEV